MSNKEISLLAVDVDSLHRRQYEALKRHIIDTLKEAIKNISEDNFKKAEQMTLAIKVVAYTTLKGDEE